ncbi:hypothetical protein RvY_06216 [Ramazzottius varieornatus]|uniref:SUEL-type lectin domain-containing protein n=1 Tax=Ramazzottius varieornatus TaxID=947166 RepID=A0A1D1UXS8_RAMVA|nr:hypothetical protein RvY_06216 [Ramazzottius varieornatus]
MTAPTFLVLSGFLLAVVSSSPPTSSDGGNIEIVIQDGQSQTVECTEVGKVVTIANATYPWTEPAKPARSTLGSVWDSIGCIFGCSQPSTSTAAPKTLCNSDMDVTMAIGNHCRNETSCQITANDAEDSAALGETCKSKRPLHLEYQCAAPVAKRGKKKEGVRAMVLELVK